jgi:hypothetical protein
MADAPKPEDMRQAMAGYVRTVHRSYLSLANAQPPALRGRMPLLGEPFTVVAAGVQNLHVIATRETMAAPSGQEVTLEEDLDGMKWTLRFYDPVVLPQLGLIDESAGPAGDQVRRALGVATHLYHLIVQPGAQLTEHHAGHAGSGLANAHLAEARDFDLIRKNAPGAGGLIEEMAGASLAGLPRALALLAREIAGNDETIQELATDPQPDPTEVRRALLAALRTDDGN